MLFFEKGKKCSWHFHKIKDEVFYLHSGKRKPITFGDVVADYEYGIKYRPDDSVPEKQWRKIRKLADLTEARQEIGDLFNHELMSLEISKSGGGSTGITEDILEKNFQEQAFIGVIAEKLARNFLTRVQYNNPDLGLKIEPSNALEDAELAYDFKIAIPERRRGIAIEGEKMPREEFVQNKRRIGIQFTIAKHGLGRKAFQVEKARKELVKYTQILKKPVDDIVLLRIQLDNSREYFKQWLKDGRPSGGPEQYLTREEKVRIFKESTKNFLDLSDEEIEKLVL